MTTQDAPARSRDRVVVAMSGGVDSSVAAALMVEAGFDVVGVTLQLYDHGAAIQRKGACCAGTDIRDAARVAERLGIAHYVLDYEARFRRDVIDDFVSSYLAGETPVPCIRCNETVKFRDLLGVARELGATTLATGHYVRRIDGPGGPELHRAADPSRDQSYFLFSMTPEQLAFTRFPVGGRPKDEIRAIAARLNLPVAAKPDSQDICFVPQGRYSDLVRRLGPKADRSGEIRDLDGRVLGRHAGIEHFTIGQRKGLGLSGAAPLFVIRLDAKARAVIVGPREALVTHTLQIGEINWLGEAPLGEAPVPVAVRVRSTRAPVEGRVRRLDATRAAVDLPGGEESVAPGQACVFSAADGGSRILGGGWILPPEMAPALDSAKARDLHPALRVAG